MHSLIPIIYKNNNYNWSKQKWVLILSYHEKQIDKTELIEGMEFEIKKYKNDFDEDEELNSDFGE